MSEEYSGYFRLSFDRNAERVHFKIRGTKVKVGDGAWREADAKERALLLEGAKRTGVVFKGKVDDAKS